MQTLVQELVHDVNKLDSEILESLELRDLNVIDNPPQLFKDQLNTLQRRILQSGNLLLRKHFESCFRNKEIRSERTGISESSLQVFITQLFEGIHSCERLVENVIEDVTNPTSSYQLTTSLLHESAFDVFSILCCIFGDSIEQDLLFILIVIFEGLKRPKFFLLLEQETCDLRTHFRQSFLDMVDYDYIEGVGEILDSEFTAVGTIDGTLSEELFFTFDCITDDLSLLDMLLTPANHSNITQSQRINFVLE